MKLWEQANDFADRALDKEQHGERHDLAYATAYGKLSGTLTNIAIEIAFARTADEARRALEKCFSR